MIAYGWTEKHLEVAAHYATMQYEMHDGPGIEIRDLHERTRRCQRGDHTLQFTLGYIGSTRRRKDGTYPGGVAFKTWEEYKLVPDALPWNSIGVRSITEGKGSYRISIPRARGLGSLCWHAYGHFMAKLFDLNPNGKIVAHNTYDRLSGFEANAGNVAREQECHCYDQGTASFFR